jgi:DNA-binding NarL/FixJ family response regulator
MSMWSDGANGIDEYGGTSEEPDFECTELFDIEAEDIERKPPLAASPLTRRETEVAELVSTGLSNRQIAAELGTTERTVKGQVSAILSKLHLENRTQIAIWIRERAA